MIRPTPPQAVCNYCHKPDHTHKDCRMANELCLVYGSSNHFVGDCPHNRTENNTPVLSALPVPPVRRNPGPVIIGTPLPPQQQAFGQAQKGQAYDLTADEV